MSGDKQSVDYRPPGPVAAAFHQSEDFVRVLKGPVGSGKSSTCCVEIVRHTMKQVPFNGVRRARWAVVRATYPSLKTTTIKTWEAWFPGHIAPIKWDTPIISRMKVKDCGDGYGMDLEIVFIAMETAQDTDKLRSLELTGAWINEASEVPKEVFDMVTQRVGRFPPKREGGPVNPCIIADTNPPDDDSYLYKFDEDKPTGFSFFHQPGALIKIVEGEKVRYEPNPDAENIFNLPSGYGYYQKMLAGKSEDWIKVFILGEYGTTADGKPVYPEYSDKVHVAAEELIPNPALPVYLGWDFGLTPACIIGQMSPKGQLLILDELVADDMGIRQFAIDVVKPLLLNKYSRNKMLSVGDPAGMNRAQTDERTCFQELLEAGIATEPANTNDFLPRRESVAFFLNRMSAGEPGFLISPSCKSLRKGFIGGYRYERLKVSGERYRDRPVKDRFSHPHDALQYLCLKARDGGASVRAKKVSTASSKGWT